MSKNYANAHSHADILFEYMYMGGERVTRERIDGNKKKGKNTQTNCAAMMCHHKKKQIKVSNIEDNNIHAK